MLITKITSSLENCFIDQNINDFDSLTQLSALKNERISFQILCAHDESDANRRRLYDISVSGDLAQYVNIREVMSLPVAIPVVPGAPCDNYLRTEPGLYPDLLIPLRYANQVSVLGGHLTSLWVEIDLREANEVVSSGEQKIKVSFCYGQDLASSAEITLDIINAVLPEQKLKMTQGF